MATTLDKGMYSKRSISPYSDTVYECEGTGILVGGCNK